MSGRRIEQDTEGVLVLGPKNPEPEQDCDGEDESVITPALWSLVLGITVILIGPVTGTPKWIIAIIGCGTAIAGAAGLTWASYLRLTSVRDRGRT